MSLSLVGVAKGAMTRVHLLRCIYAYLRSKRVRMVGLCEEVAS